LIDCSPQVVLLAVYLEEYFIKIKRIAESTMSLLELASACLSKLDAPQTGCLIIGRDTLLCQQVADITKAQIEAVIGPG
jgi:hypothetical protein|tara:strand:- start:128 stop:364 length:237 start_codon:yes stop_codon:yes gene_type:complete